MISFVRSNPPLELSDNWRKWTKRFIVRRANNPGAKFFWNKVSGIPINKIMIPILLGDTNWHWSYYDSFLLKSSDRTIDHFLPKSEHPEYAYNWINLYVACRECQDKKGIQESVNLLRPDNRDYEFNEYFMIDFTEFKLLPNPVAPKENQVKAITTIRILDLNSVEYSTARRHSFSRRIDEEDIIEDFSFRYLFY